MNVFELVASVVLDKKGYEKSLVSAEKGMTGLSKATSATQSKFTKLGSAMKTAMKVGAAAVAAVGTVTVALGKQAIDAYADYEQLAGGVQKLFGEASDQVMSFASEAYKTAGMSANQYMEQVTSFSSSLINSLGGDTAKAAEVANIAITDMADNVNTFGSSMEDVQNAYQGFAKQNYTINLMSAA